MIRIHNAIIAVLLTMVVTSFEDFFGMVFRLTQYGLIGGAIGIGILYMLKEPKQQSAAQPQR